MIRGLVPKDRLLEWTLGDGWEPICNFLSKEVPKEPFPRTNDAKGLEGRSDSIMKPRAMNAFRNMAITIAIIVGGFYSLWRLLH